MDENRTHPGRLNSAPQTVLKTAGLASMTIRQRPLEFDRYLEDSMVVRTRALMSGSLAVNLAVIADESTKSRISRKPQGTELPRSAGAGTHLLRWRGVVNMKFPSSQGLLVAVE